MIVGIINPARRHAATVEAALTQTCLADGLPPPVLLHTTVASPGVEQARGAVQMGASRVIVAGGDGTVRQVASVLAGTAVELGIVPTGTANLFAVNLGLRRRRTRDCAGVRRDVRAVLDGQGTTLHDVGRLRWLPVDNSAPPATAQTEGERTDTFLAAAGLGLDAATVAETTEALKDRLGWLAYLRVGARHLSAPPADFTIQMDGRPEERVSAWSILMGNTPRIPWGITVFPGARTDSGTLELLRTAPSRITDWAGVAFHGLRRRPQHAAALSYRAVTRLAVTAIDGPVALHLDGDAMGLTNRAEFWVEPGSLRVITPSHKPSPSPGPTPTSRPTPHPTGGANLKPAPSS